MQPFSTYLQVETVGLFPSLPSVLKMATGSVFGGFSSVIVIWRKQIHITNKDKNMCSISPE